MLIRHKRELTVAKLSPVDVFPFLCGEYVEYHLPTSYIGVKAKHLNKNAVTRAAWTWGFLSL